MKKGIKSIALLFGKGIIFGLGAIFAVYGIMAWNNTSFFNPSSGANQLTATSGETLTLDKWNEQVSRTRGINTDSSGVVNLEGNLKFQDGTTQTTAASSGGGFVFSNTALSSPTFDGTISTTWETIDLSSIVGSKQSMVYLRLDGTGAPVNMNIKPAGVSTRGAYGVTYAYLAPSEVVYLLVPTDSTGKIEIGTYSGTSSLSLTLVAYTN